MNEQIRKQINEHPTPSSNVKGNTNSNKNSNKNRVVPDYPEYKGFFFLTPTICLMVKHRQFVKLGRSQYQVKQIPHTGNSDSYKGRL